MKSYEVSIIMPIYNVEKYIERCAKSVFEQDFENIEYIFVNDCTPDNSIVLLEKVIEKYPNRQSDIKIIHHKENGGSGKARKTGLKHTSGKYIIHVDSDDWCEFDMISKLYHKAVYSHADIVVCDYFKSYSNGENQHVLQKYHADKDKNLNDLVLGKIHSGMCNKLVKKSLYEDNKLYPPEEISLLEDKWLMIRLFFYANKIEHMSIPLYYYWQGNGNSILSKITAKHWKDFFWYKSTTKDFLVQTKNHIYIKYLILSNLYIYASLIRKSVLSFLGVNKN